MNRIKSMVFAAVVALVGPNLHAQTQAAGLWERSMVTRSDDDKMNKAMADMQKQMTAMPPEVTFISDKAYSGKTLMTSQQGKWLSADCGSVKPSPSLPTR